MLERLAAWFLNTYVADYVGNVDTDQLSIGLLNGNFINSYFESSVCIVTSVLQMECSYIFLQVLWS